MQASLVKLKGLASVRLPQPVSGRLSYTAERRRSGFDKVQYERVSRATRDVAQASPTIVALEFGWMWAVAPGDLERIKT